MPYRNPLLQMTIIFLLIIPTIAKAGWPMFNVLTPEKIMSDLLIHDGCAQGEARIPYGTQVPIINRNIPRNQSWFWEYTGDPACQKMPESLQYLAFHQEGHYSGGYINTMYGIPGTTLFRFTFTIPESDWYCGYSAGPNPPQTIGCAQDTSSLAQAN